MKIFITGISSGIGKALAKQLVMRGHMVWGVARRKELLEKLQSELGEDKLFVSTCDLANIDEMKAVAAKMREQSFIPDIVVLNAGVYEVDVILPSSVLRTPSPHSSLSLRAHPSESKTEGGEGKNMRGLDLDKFGRNFQINVNAQMFWVSEFLPDFLARKKGAFIGISSTAAYRPGKTSVGYPASKAALSMAFRGLCLNYTDSGVRFSTIHFGPIRTRLWSGSKSPLIPEASKAAEFIIKVLGKKSGSYFFPFLSTMLLRLSLFLPDLFFTKFSKFLKKE